MLAVEIILKMGSIHSFITKTARYFIHFDKAPNNGSF